jgi:hypothetical protein
MRPLHSHLAIILGWNGKPYKTNHNRHVRRPQISQYNELEQR